MELMISKEESDGKRKKFCTIHTQTDFGPYSAFPPQGGNAGPSSPSTPEQERSSPRDANLSTLQEAPHLERTTDTVDGRRPENTGWKEMNGINIMNRMHGVKSLLYYAPLFWARICGTEEIPHMRMKTIDN